MHTRLFAACLLAFVFLFACAENGPSMPRPGPGPGSDPDPTARDDSGPRAPSGRDAGYVARRPDADFPIDDPEGTEDGGAEPSDPEDPSDPGDPSDPSDPPIGFCRSAAECAAGESCCAIDPETPEMFCLPFPTCPDLSE